jgi:hypothetical protein
MNTYYKVVTSEHMRSNYILGPMLIIADSKPKNSKVQTERGMRYYDYFESLEEAEDFASYMCDRNFGEDSEYDCNKHGKKKWECIFLPESMACKNC